MMNTIMATELMSFACEFELDDDAIIDYIKENEFVADADMIDEYNEWLDNEGQEVYVELDDYEFNEMFRHYEPMELVEMIDEYFETTADYFGIRGGTIYSYYEQEIVEEMENEEDFVKWYVENYMLEDFINDHEAEIEYAKEMYAKEVEEEE